MSVNVADDYDRFWNLLKNVLEAVLQIGELSVGEVDRQDGYGEWQAKSDTDNWKVRVDVQSGSRGFGRDADRYGVIDGIGGRFEPFVALPEGIVHGAFLDSMNLLECQYQGQLVVN